jgi:hypothetical protein
MTPEDKLISLCGGDAEPQLTSDELAQCLLDSATKDSNGLYLNDHDWEPTYDFNLAAAAGWQIKAGKVAADYTITIEQRELNRGQMIDNFLKMAETFRKRAQPRFFGASGLLPPWRV